MMCNRRDILCGAFFYAFSAGNADGGVSVCVVFCDGVYVSFCVFCVVLFCGAFFYAFCAALLSRMVYSNYFLILLAREPKNHIAPVRAH
jgi:hypothetical protein